MPRHFSTDELGLLRELRAVFLSSEERAGGGEGPYWLAAEELALYDEFFGARIGWKWDAVLLELRRRERLPSARSVLDWGCGSGIAARRVLAAVPGVARVHLWDHAPAARAHAAERVRAEFPAVEVSTELPGEPVDALLASHVLGELAPAALDELLALAAAAAAVLWVEPGARLVSRRLGDARARLLATHHVLAPCPHEGACGALARDDAWCHLFARPANAVYTEGAWAELGRELGIDLRSLPYSFLALARRDLPPPPPGPAVRLLGRPRPTRGRTELEICRAEGVDTVDFLQRTDKPLFKALADVAGEPWLFDADLQGTRITRLERRDR